jgi:kynurenine formamidase
MTLLDLSHPIRDGETTHPGLPVPVIGTHLSREDSRARYAPGTEFDIGKIAMVGNTGTYLDTPFHRYLDGFDLAGLALERCVDLDGVVVRVADRRAIDVDLLAGVEIAQRAVLFDTGWSRHFGTPAYGVDAPFLTEEAARRLVGDGATLVGIDSVNIDSLDGNARPAHSVLLAAGIPIVEHLTALDRLPDHGFRFTAVPAPVVGMGTFPVRAFARLDV